MVSALTYTYDGSVGTTTAGDLIQRTDTGKFGTNGLHRITRASGANFPFPYNDPPLAILPSTQNITYTSYHQPSTISETVYGIPYQLEYLYDADQQRNYSKLRNMNTPGTPVEERWDEHGLETVRHGGSTSNTHKALYVEGGDGLCAMIVAEPGGAHTTYSIYTDHLGSVTALTKKVGTMATVVARRSYDPWGRERNANTWNGAPATTPAWLYRGFTGHEHVQPFGLISPEHGAEAVTRAQSAKPPRLSLRRDSRSYRDERKASTALGGTAISGRSRSTAPWSGLHMNARMYDPVNGRMLAPDNYVNGAFASQAFNRYSYACNNPLKYTDPDGKVALIDDAILGLIGGFSNLIGNWGNIENVGQGFAYFGIGFVSGAVSEYITPMGAAMLAGAMNAGYQGYQANGTVDPGAMLKGAVISGAVSGLSMGLGSMLGPVADKAFGGIANPVLRGSLTQGVAGAGIGAFGGGLGAAMGGGDFWQGAGQGAMMGLGTGLATGGYSGFLAARGESVVGERVFAPKSK